MKYSVKYSSTAIRDLDRIYNEVFEACRDYDTAQKYMDVLMDKVDSKSEYPGSGAPLYYEDLFTGYYFVVFKAYLAFYRIKDNQILVDRVLFSASDYMRYLHLKAKEE